MPRFLVVSHPHPPAPRRRSWRCAVTAILSLSLWTGFAAAPAQMPARHPNVVLIMPDDVSFDDFSFANAHGPRTPHLDALSRESVRLTDFHVSPTCSPTRAALLTGRYNNATGVWHTILGRYFLRPDEITLAEIFRANGYRTGLFGKWHLGEAYPLRPRDRGFERVVTHRGGGVDQQHNFWGNRNTAPAMIYEDDRLVAMADDDDGIAGAFATNTFTTRALEFMRERAAQAEPFFVYLPYNVAHAPQDMPPDARSGTDARTASIENMDKNVGRVLAFLAQARFADDTLVLFLTDNGMNSAGLRAGKGSHYDGGHRVPCFVRWKNGGLGGDPSRAREVAQLTSHIDLLPTLLQLLSLHDVSARRAGVPLHGRSLATILDADPANDDTALRTRTLAVDNQRLDRLTKFKQASVMRDEFDARGNLTRKWRLTAANGTGRDWELYDALADPKQARNLIAQPEHAAIVAQLKADYETWWSEVSRRGDDYVRVVVGSPGELTACLYSHDWHTDGNVPWSHTMVAEGMTGNGFNAVQFAQAGRYTFDLRRWPREIAAETTATSTLQTPILSARGNQPIRGKALPIHSARLRVWQGDKTLADEKGVLPEGADGVELSVPLPAGPAFVQTWFYDAAGAELAGAYYVYVNATAPTGAAPTSR